MTSFLRTLVLYLLAVNIGAAVMMIVVPFLAVTVFGASMPWRLGPDMAIIFGYYAFIRGWLIWMAASLSALTAFLMTHRPLRYAMLSVPAWAPLCYVVIYMALVAQ